MNLAGYLIGERLCERTYKIDLIFSMLDEFDAKFGIDVVFIRVYMRRLDVVGMWLMFCDS